MTKDLIERVKRLIGSGVSDLIRDDPADVARATSSNSSEAAITLVRDRLGVLIAERHRLARQIDDEAQAFESLEAKAQTAVSLAREDLAYAALSERARLKDMRDKTLERLSEIDTESRRLEALVNALRADDGASVSAGEVQAKLDELDRLIAGQQET